MSDTDIADYLQRARAHPDQPIFFCGIGGSGMSALAQILRARGIAVAGSDRSHDRGQNSLLFQQLADQGVQLTPQDGSGVTDHTTCVVASTAVEAQIPDLAAARELSTPLVHRADLLAALLNGGDGIAVGGTSGKSTVTGMIGYIFHELGADPCVINGGIMVNAQMPPFLGNAICGNGRMVAEVDESDGTIVKYHPAIGVVTSISEDHKPLPEIRQLFQQFADQTSGPILYHAGCQESIDLLASRADTITFGIDCDADWNAMHLQTNGLSMTYTLRGEQLQLPLPGHHNVQNALAAIAVADAAGLDWRAAAHALAGFRGIHRRFEIVGTADGITVIDDFAHNPEKIAAVLQAATAAYPRILAVFQPHGYGPTRFMRDGYVNAFRQGLRSHDALAFLPIYDAGGTADRSISSDDLAADLTELQATAAPRDAAHIRRLAVGYDVDAILLLGARDPLLPALAREIHAART